MYPYISRFLLENQNKQIACPEERAKVGAEIARIEELAKKSPLFEALLSNESKSLEHLEKLLLEKGETHKEEIANTSTEWGDSLLMLAVYKGHYDKALLLMKAGARADAVNRDNVSVMKLLSFKFLRNNGSVIKFIYHAFFKAKGKENINKKNPSELILDTHCLDEILSYVSHMFVWDMKSNPALFSYYYVVLKKLLALGAYPTFPDGRNIFHLVIDEISQINFNIILELIEIFDKKALKLLSEVKINNVEFFHTLGEIACKSYVRPIVFDKVNHPYYFSALKVFIDWISNNMQPHWNQQQSLYNILLNRIRRIESMRQEDPDADSVSVRFFTMEFILQFSNLQPLGAVLIDNNFYDHGFHFSYKAEHLNMNVEDKLTSFLKALKTVKYKPNELRVTFSDPCSFSEEFLKFIYLFPIHHLTLEMGRASDKELVDLSDISYKFISNELMDAPADEIELHIHLSSLSKALEVLGQNKNVKTIAIVILDCDSENDIEKGVLHYENMLQAILNLFSGKKDLKNFRERPLYSFFESVNSYIAPLYVASDLSAEQKKILTKMEELFHHLSTCTLLSEFSFPLFYCTNIYVFNKLKECLSSNYSLIDHDLFSICDTDNNIVPEAEAFAFYKARNKAFAPLLRLYNQWVGLLPLEPEFQISPSKGDLPKMAALGALDALDADDDIVMEYEPKEPPQEKEFDCKRAKEESIAKDSTKGSKREKEMKMAKEPPSALEEMEHYAETLDPAIKEKLFQAMIDLIPKIDEKYRNECCYILANEFLLNRLTEESMAAKILNLIPPPPVAIDHWYKEAQDKLSFIVGVKDHKARLAHRLECRDENSNGVIPRLISSMHTPEQDEDGDAIMDLVPPASYNLSLTGPSIAEFVDYSSKQYLAIVKEKEKCEKELKRTAEAKEKCENDLQIMQARLEQMIAEKDAETKRLQEKNAELERLQKRITELEALNGGLMSQQDITQPKPLAFSCDAPSSLPLNRNPHKRKADELNNGEEGKKEEEGRVNTKRVKTHHDA